MNIRICTIDFKHIENSNHTESFASNTIVKVFDYRDSLDDSYFALGGTYLESIPLSYSSFTILGIGRDPILLRDQLQKEIDTGKDYFQLKLGLDSITNGDNIMDAKDIHNCSEDIELYMSYFE